MSTTRPALDELQSKLRPGDTVVVARFFRLGRSRDHLIKLISEFNKLHIHFKALDLGVDSEHIGRPKGINYERFEKVKKALKEGFPWLKR